MQCAIYRLKLVTNLNIKKFQLTIKHVQFTGTLISNFTYIIPGKIVVKRLHVVDGNKPR